MKITVEPDPNIFGERFLSKIDVTEGCWVWKFGTFKDGYGQFWYERRGISAHRYSWIKAYGEIPGKLFVLHKCDNSSCVNPNHLFLGTLQDNSEDMRIKGRGASGERNGNSKLTIEKVREIRSLYQKGKAGYKSPYSMKGLAITYGLGVSTISSIVLNQTWRDEIV